MRIVVALVLTLAACAKADKSEDKPRPAVAPVTQGTVVNGVRTIQIEAGKDGYVPERITGKPGEKLTLVFTRTIDADCLSELVTPDKKKVALPMNKAVEVPVTVPADGEVGFACGMDMFHGVIVAEKAK
jgi:plastocyanin domain-containing protein